MIPLAAIGLGLQGFQMLGNMFSESPEARAERQKKSTLRDIQLLRMAALQQGIPQLQANMGSMTEGARSGAIRRLAASGRNNPNDVEAAIAPVERSATMTGSRMLKDFIAGTNNWANQASLQAELGFAGAPGAPPVTDYLGAAGSALQNYGMFQQYNQTLKGLNSAGMPSPAAPAAPGTVSPAAPAAPAVPKLSAAPSMPTIPGQASFNNFTRRTRPSGMLPGFRQNFAFSLH